MNRFRHVQRMKGSKIFAVRKGGRSKLRWRDQLLGYLRYRVQELDHVGKSQRRLMSINDTLRLKNICIETGSQVFRRSFSLNPKGVYQFENVLKLTPAKENLED